MEDGLIKETVLEIRNAIVTVPCQVIALMGFTLVNIVGNLFIYSVIWTRNHGSDTFRNLLHYLSTHNCLYIILSNLTCLSLKMSLFCFPTMPQILCLAQEFGSHYFIFIGCLTAFEANILSYLYLFRWKNLGALNDDFWNMYLFALNNILAIWTSCIYLLGNGLFQPLYYLCSSQAIRPMSMASPDFTPLFYLITICMTAFVWMRVFLYRRTWEREERRILAITLGHRGRGPKSFYVATLRKFTIFLAISILYGCSIMPILYFTLEPQEIVLIPEAFPVALFIPHLFLSFIYPLSQYCQHKEMAAFLPRHLGPCLYGGVIQPKR